MSNRLVHETSPYLLQHAHNPVDWYPWGEEAFAKAKAEDKPVLVSIGYAACHWCHVMERESFENEEVAAIMNEHFVNIKVDREERPDVDAVYMDAVQAITGSGGWPLNVFLTPDRRPFYGGTYYPPKAMFNRGAWSDVLLSLSKAYRERKGEIEEQAQQLTEHIKASGGFAHIEGVGSGIEVIEQAIAQIMKAADKEWGGFGKAPKFPQTFTITNLLHHAYFTDDQPAREQALLSLDKMIAGGIYDQLGGGFARYSTDTEWLAPHFEKMLYDNALIVSALCEAYACTRNEKYREVIAETFAFVERELMHPQGGFYSALDADSEGVEGKFYVWDHQEVMELLGEDGELFAAYYNIRPGGNWEHKSIPRTLVDLESFVGQHQLDAEHVKAVLKRGKEVLMKARDQRVRPQLDDKVLLNWNALMNKAYSQAYACTGVEAYRGMALRNMEFIYGYMQAGKGLFHHTWKGQGKVNAFLDDYACLADALISLASISGDWTWIEKAVELVEQLLLHFKDSDSSLFFYTPAFQQDILVRKKEVYDGATPSGNGVLARVLLHLSILTDRPEWRKLSEDMLSAMSAVAVRYPTSFGLWLDLLMEMHYGTAEVAVVGKDASLLAREALQKYFPYRLLVFAKAPHQDIPLLAEKKPGVETLIFLCRNYVCKTPVKTAFALEELFLQNNRKTMQ